MADDKITFNAFVDSKLNEETQEFECVTHATLLKQVAENTIFQEEGNPQTIASNLDLKGDVLVEKAIKIAQGFYDSDSQGVKYTPAHNASVDWSYDDKNIVNIEIGDRRYFVKWWATSLGIPDLEFDFTDLEEAEDDRLEQARIWASKEIMHSVPDKKIYSIERFKFDNDLSGFLPLEEGTLKVDSSTQDGDQNKQIITWVLNNSGDTFHAEAFYDVAENKFSGWQRIQQVTSFSNAQTMTLKDVDTQIEKEFIDVKNIITGVGANGTQLNVGEAVIMTSGSISTDYNEYLPVNARSYCNGIVTSKVVADYNNLDVHVIAMSAGIYNLGIVMDGHSNFSPLWLNNDDSQISFDKAGDSSRLMGYKLNATEAFLDPLGSNREIIDFTIPDVNEITIIHGWVIDPGSDPYLAPKEADIEFAETNIDSDYDTRNMNVLPDDVPNTICESKRPDAIYASFWMGIPTSAGITPTGIYLGEFLESDEVDIVPLQYNGVDYTVIYTTPSANNDKSMFAKISIA